MTTAKAGYLGCYAVVLLSTDWATDDYNAYCLAVAERFGGEYAAANAGQIGMMFGHERVALSQR